MTKPWKIKAAAILLLIFGVPIVFLFLFAVGVALFKTAKYGGLYSADFGLAMALGIFGAVLPFGIVSTLGGIYALKRRKWGLVLAGSITEAIIIWFLGIPAIVLTILARDEFKAGSQSTED